MLFEMEESGDDTETLLRPGKDEMNFAEFPIALLTDRVPKGQQTIKFEDQIFDQKRKRLITRKRIIEGSAEYGLPTATDDAVILALIQVTKNKGNFTRRDVEFSRLELIKLLGWADEGRNYDRIKLSLLRIANVTYNYDNAWWDGRQKTWTTKVFHILDTVEINDSRATSGQGGLFPSRVVWNEVVFDSFQAGFLRNIDFQLCMRLEHPTALRMYRFLGKRFHIKAEWSFDLREFAYDHIGLGRNYEGGTQIARKLRPAIEELEGVGFLAPMPFTERFSKKGRDWTVHFIHRPPCPAEPPAPVVEKADPDAASVTGALIARGVTQSTAQELAEQFPPELIRGKIDVLDWLIEKKDKRAAKSPAGYLVKSIRTDYAAPKGYVSREERQRLETRRQEEASRKMDAKRREQMESERERLENEQIDAYWDNLTPSEQAALEQAARANADPATFKLATGALRSIGDKILRRGYIRNRLIAEGKLPKTGDANQPS